MSYRQRSLRYLEIQQLVRHHINKITDAITVIIFDMIQFLNLLLENQLIGEHNSKFVINQGFHLNKHPQKAIIQGGILFQNTGVEQVN